MNDQQKILVAAADQLVIEGGQDNLRRAFRFLATVGDAMPATEESEPERGAVYLQAAAIASRCGDGAAARLMISKGLIGYPDREREEAFIDLLRELRVRDLAALGQSDG